MKIRWIPLWLLAASTTARAAPTSLVLGDLTLEVSAIRPLTVVPDGAGVLIEASGMPRIRIDLDPEPCERTTDRRLSTAPPPGFLAARSLPPSVPHSDRGWDALCMAADRATLRVLVEIDDSPVLDAREQRRMHVAAVLGSLAHAARPPIEIAPRVIVPRAEITSSIRRGAAPGELVIDGISLDVALREPRCPADTDETICRELADRAIVVRPRDLRPAPGSSLPPVALQLRDEIFRIAEREYGKATWLHGDIARDWTNGVLPFRLLPAGAWKLSERDRELRLYEVTRGADVRIAARDCRAFWASPPPGARVERPGFLRVRTALVDVRKGWSATSCLSINSIDLVVVITLPGPPDMATAQAFANAFAEPAERWRWWFTLDGMTNGRVGGFGLDAWVVDRWSIVGRVEFLGIESDVGPRAARLEVAGGLGLSRPRLRAGLHLGVGLENPPLRVRTGEDQAGGSLFVDARAMRQLPPVMLSAAVRAAYYVDLDCTDNPDGDGCGKSDSSDFAARYGLELEVRVALGKRAGNLFLGGFVGARYAAVWTEELRDDVVLVTFGPAMW